MALKKGEQTGLNQGRFGFSKGPESKLRATRVKANDEARGVGFRIFENMRVPEQSVIFRVHENDPYSLCRRSRRETLSWWVSSARDAALGVCSRSGGEAIRLRQIIGELERDFAARRMSVKLTPSAEVSTLLRSLGRAVSVPTSVESTQLMFEYSASTPRDARRGLLHVRPVSTVARRACPFPI